jgi:hypothetical protein
MKYILLLSVLLLSGCFPPQMIGGGHDGGGHDGGGHDGGGRDGGHSSGGHDNRDGDRHY